MTKMAEQVISKHVRSWMTATNAYSYFLIYEPLPVFLITKCLLQEPLW